MSSRSYLTNTFTVADPDARLRKDDDLNTFVTAAGGAAKTIPKGTKVRVSDIKTVPVGVKSIQIFAHTTRADGTAIGWTSAGNLAGKFISETLGEVPPPPNTNQFGPNAAWRDGSFIGQITLVKILGTNSEVEFVAKAVCEPFLAMVAAAEAAGRTIAMNSGFRTFAEQKHLHDGFTRKLPGFNPANRPGTSNHQNGIAFDLDVKPGEGNRNYEWLKSNATLHGFIRTVSREAWHWEFLPEKAAAARARGIFGTFM